MVEKRGFGDFVISSMPEDSKLAAWQYPAASPTVLEFKGNLSA